MHLVRNLSLISKRLITLSIWSGMSRNRKFYTLHLLKIILKLTICNKYNNRIYKGDTTRIKDIGCIISK